MWSWISDWLRSVTAPLPGPEERPRARLKEVVEFDNDPDAPAYTPPPPKVELTDVDRHRIEPEPKVPRVGAWAGLSALKNPVSAVAACRNLGLTRLDVIVNDHSTWRSRYEFDTRSTTEIAALCRLARDAGVEVHLMSWIMPHEKYIDGAAEVLVPLAGEVGAASVQWDAEEPWTQAVKPMSYPAAAKRIADAFKDLPCKMGANAIGYTPARKFGPLAEVCDYVVPQCYSTSTSHLDPSTVVPKITRHWRRVFGPKDLAIGLAAYRQTGIPGYTKAQAMQAAFASVKGLEGDQDVVYWSLPAIRRSASTSRIVKNLVGQNKTA